MYTMYTIYIPYLMYIICKHNVYDVYIYILYPYTSLCIYIIIYNTRHTHFMHIYSALLCQQSLILLHVFHCIYWRNNYCATLLRWIINYLVWHTVSFLSSSIFFLVSFISPVSFIFQPVWGWMYVSSFSIMFNHVQPIFWNVPSKWTASLGSRKRGVPSARNCKATLGGPDLRSCLKNGRFPPKTGHQEKIMGDRGK